MNNNIAKKCPFCGGSIETLTSEDDGNTYAELIQCYGCKKVSAITTGNEVDDVAKELSEMI